MKSLAIFGSTGSIGSSSLSVYKKHKSKFNLLYLSSNSNYKKLFKQYKIYKPKNILITNNLKKITHSKLVTFNEILKNNKVIDYVISGVSGYEALELNLKLIKISKNLLIANKETIICGGNFFLNEAKKFNCNIIPIDSEHYCLSFFLKNFKNKNQIKNIYLIASGGPFLNKKISSKETLKKTLKHPNWKMGKVISINSSTFANKILELFEAKILFNIPAKKLKILVEPNSIAHILIELKNNLFLPILHKPTMRIAISNSLGISSSEKYKICDKNLKFLKPDIKKFPMVKLGYRLLLNHGLASKIIFTVLNERLVKLYMEGNIDYGDIVKILLKNFKKKHILSKLNCKIYKYKDIINLVNYLKKIKL